MEILEENRKKFFKMLFILAIVLSLYFIVKIGFEIKKTIMLGENTTPATISFSGHGEIKATPDIANIYFTITKDAATVKDAQAGVAVIEKNALDLLNTKGVDTKDIQTTDASFNPKYEYKQAICPSPVPMPVPLNGGVTSTNSIAIYCNPGKQIIVGYTASESITVKIRNIDTVGDIIQALGATGISDLSGPDFTIDNPDALQVQARKLAIDDAKAKAQVLAKDLGVSLGKITSFDESGNSPVPMYAQAMAVGSASGVSAPAQLPAGQNTISSDVTITYEIK